MAKTLRYETRDGSGKDIVKEIAIKEFRQTKCECSCDICGAKITDGIKIKDAVSSNFTDWAYFHNGYVCCRCSELFSVFPYSYIYSPNGGIQLMNVRQLRDKLTTLENVEIPFMFCISTSQKKHLFYRAKLNNSTNHFAVNLETETILTSCKRQKLLFDFVENLQTLGCTKEMLKSGKISQKIPIKRAPIILDFLWSALSTSREIQIPLYCGQKREITEVEALCNLDLVLTS